MKNLFLLFSAMFAGISLVAQESSDPATKAILESMKNQYESYESVSVDFSLSIQFPEEDPEVQSGQLWLANEKYHLVMGGQTIICDGNTLWFYLKDRNEVQINDYEEEENGDIMSPKDLFKIYEKDDYIYAIVFDGLEEGKSVQKIEFKPTDPDSEYSKMRMTINKKNKNLIRVKAFGKDGSRYTLALNTFSPNKALDSSKFVFNPANYPDVQIEDLRN